MEAGVDIYTIRRWMGHTSLVTTGRYMHVTAGHLATVKSPLDTLYAAEPPAPMTAVRRQDEIRTLGAFKPHSSHPTAAAPFNTFYPLCG